MCIRDSKSEGEQFIEYINKQRLQLDVSNNVQNWMPAFCVSIDNKINKICKFVYVTKLFFSYFNQYINAVECHHHSLKDT